MARKLWKSHGSYYLRRRVRVDGKEVTKYRNLGRDRYAAIDRARMLEDVPDLADHPTVKAFSTRWLDEYVAGRRNEQGRDLAKQRLRDHVLPEIGGKLMAEIRSPDLRLLRLSLDAGKLSPQSVAHVLADVRCLFRYAVEAEVVPRSPWIRGLMPRLQERVPDRLTDAEVDKLVALPDPSYGATVSPRHGSDQPSPLGGPPMAHLSPFSFDFIARPPLVEEILAILAALEIRNPDLVPIAIPASSGRRVVLMYLDDATFIDPTLAGT